MRLRRRIWEIIDVAAPGDVASRIFDVFIMTLISLNVVMVVLETVKSLQLAWGSFFKWFELFSVIVFTIEYLLRFVTCTTDERFKHPLKGRIRFALTAMALVDLLAILPFYLPMVVKLDLRFIRAIRLFRLFRLFKMGRYSSALQTLHAVLVEKREELLIAVFAVMILLIISSSMMFYIENEVQPDAFPSIPGAMWWGVATLTTVGYGDVYPLTPIGKFLGALIALTGIGIFALPAGILASGFSERIQKSSLEVKRCPHCGGEI